MGPATATGFAFVSLALSLVVSKAEAQDPPCPFQGQKPMLVVQLFFGQSAEGGKPISQSEWRSFLGRTVSPRFPDGFTVYDAYGQWRDPSNNAIGREKTKVVQIATEDTPDVRTHIDELSRIYRDRFHQKSVGIVTQAGCAAF